MAVYVDPLFGYGGSATFRWKHSCHMYADNTDELHAFARRIGLKKAWFQMSNSGLPHYDLNASRRAAAIRAGVVQHSFKVAHRYWKSKGWVRALKGNKP